MDYLREIDGICPAWLDRRHAGERGRFRCITKATTGEVVGSGTAQGNRRGCVAAGPLGKISNGPARDSAGTGASRRRLRIADRGAGPDHSGGRAMAALLAVFAGFEREILGERG